MNIKYYSTLLLICVSSVLFGQKPVGLAKLQSDIVAKNEPVIITLTLNARAEKVIMPPMENFKVIGEPTDSKTTSEMQGDEESAIEIVTQTYTCAIIPKMVGKFTIQPFTFIVKGQEYRTNELKIRVEDRKVSWQDSADVASTFTKFSIGSEGSSYVPPKTAIDYNKTDKTLVPKEEPIGKGIPSFEIKPSKTKYTVKAGEDFIVEYQIYKEAPRSEFVGNIEMIGYDDLKNFTLIDGPVRHLKIQANSTTRIQEGTAEVILEAPEKTGTYTLSSMRIKYDDTIITSQAIEIIVE